MFSHPFHTIIKILLTVYGFLRYGKIYLNTVQFGRTFRYHYNSQEFSRLLRDIIM